MHITIINGPNLNLLGKREPEIYGTTDLQTLHGKCVDWATDFGMTAECFQSNSQGEIVTKIQDCVYNASAFPTANAIIINAAGLTHTSVSILDALQAVDVPFYEVHLSNVYAREKFRHTSLLSAKATGVICGLGILGYKTAIESIANNYK